MALLLQVGLGDRGDAPAAALAYGDLKRLEFALALAAAPRLLLMDEPTAGMAPGERTALMALVVALVRERGMTVLFTEHSMDVVFGFAERVARAVARPTDRRRRTRGSARRSGRAGGLPREAKRDARVARSARNARRQREARMTLLALRAVDAWYGAAQVVYGATLAVEAGEVVALIGRNGAGKTSLLRAIMGLMPRATGEIELAGAAIARLPPHQRARRGLGYVPEDRRIFTDLTVRENLLLAARPQPGGFGERELLEIFPNLADMLERPASQMSGGEQQMLAVARTLAANPRVVLLDEPSEGIAPLIVARMKQAVGAMRSRGVAILLSEQNLAFVAGLADRAVLIEQGHIVGAATRDDIEGPSAAIRRVLGIER